MFWVVEVWIWGSYNISIWDLKRSRGPFLIMHKAAFIISRREGHLSSLLLAVSVWISGGSGDKATFSSPFLHNCQKHTELLPAGEVLWCTPIPPVSCWTTVSLAVISSYLQCTHSYLHVQNVKPHNEISFSGFKLIKFTLMSAHVFTNETKLSDDIFHKLGVFASCYINYCINEERPIKTLQTHHKTQ